jgi:tRNA(fMet)-specific endonuclease VapC
MPAQLRYLLDTSIVSIPASPKPDPAVMVKLEENIELCAIGAPTWHELSLGCFRLAHGKRQHGLQDYLQEVIRKALPILPYDDRAASWHAEERAWLESIGGPAPFADGQIAAIAKVNSFIPVSVNEKDFVPFQELSVENWAGEQAFEGADHLTGVSFQIASSSLNPQKFRVF